MNQAKPKVVNVSEITETFFEFSPVNSSEAYELMGEPSDVELDMIDHIVEDTELAEKSGCLLFTARLKDSGRTLVCKACRFDEYAVPIIALALFNAQSEKIESYSLFANEGKGFWPINFHTVAV